MTLDLEIYYYMYDGVVEQDVSRRALLRANIDLYNDFDYGDSVKICFQEKHGSLLLKTIVRSDASSIPSGAYILNGIFEGQDETNGEGLIGFVFHVTRAEYVATEMSIHSTKVVRAYFTSRKQHLLFKDLRIVDCIDRKPILRK